ncbi:hypothetical protein Pint_15784 [Pistacia integerrima]|uniref:Uncharacterized protein n=1 Tax=Pistacia integerrima TaxID=434235 RepID=A0ACC0ZAJ2_9ROSI|nr:hypothetical protein Pint_15784 [Pistacia integerrima]
MLRSSSSSRVIEELLVKSSPSKSLSRRPAQLDHNLPTYNPLSYAAKRERSRLRFAENAVHVIPIVLVFCAIVLWLFSNHGRK